MKIIIKIYFIEQPKIVLIFYSGKISLIYLVAGIVSEKYSYG